MGTLLGIAKQNKEAVFSLGGNQTGENWWNHKQLNFTNLVKEKYVVVDCKYVTNIFKFLYSLHFVILTGKIVKKFFLVIC